MANEFVARKGFISKADSTISGSLIVTDSIIAQELDIQSVTSSIIYSSGSNIFGDESSDVQEFTGSVRLNDSLYLQNSGTAGPNTTGKGLYIKNASGTDRLTLYRASGNAVRLDNQGDGDTFMDIRDDKKFYVYNASTSTELLTVSSSGDIGFGTQTPKVPLHIVDPLPNIRLEDSDNNSFTQIYYNTNSLTIAVDDGNASSTGKLRIDVGNTEHIMTVSSSGYVGIGTSSPNTMLHISDTLGSAIVKLERNDTAIVDGDIYGAIEFEGQDINSGASGVRGSIHGEAEASLGQMSLVFSTAAASVANAEKMRITSAGDVGIGTTDPQQQVHVHNSGTGAQIQFTDSNSGGSLADGLRVGWNGTYGQVYLFENADLRFGTSNIERMRIDSGGRVGIGTTSPDTNYLTHIYSTASAQILTLETTVDAGVGTNLVIKNTNDRDVGIQFYWGDGGATNGGIAYIWADGNGDDALKISAGSNYSGEENIEFYQTGNTAVINKLKVGAAGSNPSATLEVQGDATISSLSGVSQLNINGDATGSSLINFGDEDDGNVGRIYYDHTDNYLQIKTNDNEALRIDSSRNVGIGTTTVQAPLHVNGATINNVAIFQSTDANANIRVVDDAATIQIENNAGKLILGADLDAQQADSYISFEIDASDEKMRITSAGDVGIGKSVPLGTLHVQSATTDPTYLILDKSGTSSKGIKFNRDTATDASIIVNDQENLEIGYNEDGLGDSFIISNSGSNVLVIDSSGDADYKNFFTSADLGVGYTTQGYDFRPLERVTGNGQAQDSTIDLNQDLLVAWNAGSGSYLDLPATQTYATATFSQSFDVGFVGGTRYFAKVKAYDSQTANLPVLCVNDGTEHAMQYERGRLNGGIKDDSNSWFVFDITDDVVTGANTIKVYLKSGQKTYLNALYVFSSIGIHLPNEPYEMPVYSDMGFGLKDKLIINPSGELANINAIDIQSNLVQIGEDETYSGYGAIGFGGLSNGFARIFGNDTNYHLYLNSGTGGDIRFRTNGSATNKMVLVGSDLGIGTETPQRMLHVSESTAQGVARFQNSSPTMAFIDFLDANTTAENKVRVGAKKDDLSLWAGGGERIYVTGSNGYVGIGTTSPQSLLNLVGSSAAIRIEESGGAQVRMAAGGSTGYLGTYTNHELQFLINGNNAITVNTSRNVGIGKTNPTVKLDVAGIVQVSDYIRIDRSADEQAIVFGDSGGDDTCFITVNDGQGNFNMMLGVDGTGQYVVTNDGAAKTLYSGHGQDGVVSLNAAPQGTAGNVVSYSIGLSVDSNDNTIRVGASNDDLGLTDLDGNIVFDVTGSLFTKYAYLDRNTGEANIKGTGEGHIVIDPLDASHNVYLSHYTAGDVILAGAGGYVGVRTSSPSTPLEVKETSNATLRLNYGEINSNDGEDYYGGIEFYAEGSSYSRPTSSAYIKAIHTRQGTGHTNSDAGLTFGTSTNTSDAQATERMRIKAVDGNVGIGSVDPSYRLVVDNTDLATDDATLYVENDNSNSSTVAIFKGGSDHIYIKGRGSSGDYEIGNSGQGNALYLQDGTGGLGFLYAGSSVLDADVNGVKIYPPSGQTDILTISTATNREFYWDTINPDHLKKNQNLVLNADPTNTHADTVIQFDIDNATKMTINNSGYVGIGDNSPTAVLTVTGDISSNWAGRFENENGNGYGVLAFTNGNNYADIAFEARGGDGSALKALGNKDVEFYGGINRFSNTRKDVVIGGTTSSYQYLDTREYMQQKGHYAESAWIPGLFQNENHDVVPYLDNTNVYVDGVLKISNASAFTRYTINNADLSANSRITADKPIIVQENSTPDAMPINTSFTGKYLGSMANRYFPVDAYIYSPHGTATVEIYRSTNAIVDVSSPSSADHMYTVEVSASDGFQWQEDVHNGGRSVPSSGENYYVFKSNIPICAGWYPGGGDYMLMAPAGMEMLGNSYTTSDFTFFDNNVSGSISTTSQGDGRLFTELSGLNGAFAAGTADGAGGDAEYAVPIEYLSDYYIHVDPSITNYRITAHKPTKIVVLDKDGNVFDTVDLSNASKTRPYFYQTGSDAGDTTIGTNGPYRFIGSSTFYIVSQEPSADGECVLLGALQSEIAKHQSFLGGSIPNNLIVTGSITATGDVTANDFITTSDRRLKSEIKEIESGLEILKLFKSYTYTKNENDDAGFIAQEVQEALPYAVTEGSNGFLTMKDRPVLAHIHKAVMELEQKLQDIEDKIK